MCLAGSFLLNAGRCGSQLIVMWAAVVIVLGCQGDQSPWQQPLMTVKTMILLIQEHR
jgi:hypothetical protein